jgi:hypothetical protein
MDEPVSISLNDGREIFLRGNTTNPSKVVFFIHGFGSNEKGGNLIEKAYPDRFTPTLAKELDSETLVISFNFSELKEEYDEVLEKFVQRQYFPSLSKMAQVIKDVVDRISLRYPEVQKSFIGHSMGTLAILKYLDSSVVDNVGNISLLAIPTRPNSSRMRTYFMKKEGSRTDGETDYLMRSDGTQTIVTSGFWHDQDQLDLITLLKNISYKFPEKLSVVVASRDTVLYPELGVSAEEVERLYKEHYTQVLSILDSNGNTLAVFPMRKETQRGHDFQDETDAEALVEFLKNILNNENKSIESEIRIN